MFNHDLYAAGWTVLMACADGLNVAMAEWLVQSGADVNRAMDTGWTAMHSAAKVSNLPTLELLLQNGGNKNATARHRDFGNNVTPEDVSVDGNVLALLKKF